MEGNWWRHWWYRDAPQAGRSNLGVLDLGAIWAVSRGLKVFIKMGRKATLYRHETSSSRFIYACDTRMHIQCLQNDGIFLLPIFAPLPPCCHLWWGGSGCFKAIKPLSNSGRNSPSQFPSFCWFCRVLEDSEKN